MSELSFVKTWGILYFINVFPIAYGMLYEAYKKIPYPDFMEAMSMLILVPPVLIGELTGVTWLTTSHLAPSTLGVILSFCMWLAIDALLAYVMLHLMKLFL